MAVRLSLKIACVLCAIALAPAAIAAEKGKGKAKAKADDGEAKALSGMSIMGNNEAPKSLYIVPWKSSEIGGEAKLKSSLLNDAMTPVDRETFARELEFYEISSRDK